MTIHNEAKNGEIAKTVLMPGDPMRVKFIAEKYLTDAKLVNEKRGIYAYTGKYKGKEITVMASGMGIPSMGIYAYELYKFYDVENIIRIGSCGAYTEDLELLDIVLVNESYTESNFSVEFSGKKESCVSASDKLNKVIEETADERNIKYMKVNSACAEVFDAYMENPQLYVERLPKDKNIKCSEMEAFALLYIAKKLGKDAACLLTVSDSAYSKKILTVEERQNSLIEMIELALDSTLKI